jgi:LysR family cys regulon transcriptional activator
VARIAFKRGAYLRSFVYAFAQLVAPRLSRQLIEQTLAGQSSGEDESL